MATCALPSVVYPQTFKKAYRGLHQALVRESKSIGAYNIHLKMPLHPILLEVIPTTTSHDNANPTWCKCVQIVLMVAIRKIHRHLSSMQQVRMAPVADEAGQVQMTTEVSTFIRSVPQLVH